MIRYGKGLMSPLCRTVYDVLNIANPVHIAHLCMAVQLHSLFKGLIGPLALGISCRRLHYPVDPVYVVLPGYVICARFSA